jgi:hypothetical protein
MQSVCQFVCRTAEMNVCEWHSGKWLVLHSLDLSEPYVGPKPTAKYRTTLMLMMCMIYMRACNAVDKVELVSLKMHGRPCLAPLTAACWGTAQHATKEQSDFTAQYLHIQPDRSVHEGKN